LSINGNIFLSKNKWLIVYNDAGNLPESREWVLAKMKKEKLM